VRLQTGGSEDVISEPILYLSLYFKTHRTARLSASHLGGPSLSVHATESNRFDSSRGEVDRRLGTDGSEVLGAYAAPRHSPPSALGKNDPAALD